MPPQPIFYISYGMKLITLKGVKSKKKSTQFYQHTKLPLYTENRWVNKNGLKKLKKAVFGGCEIRR